MVYFKVTSVSGCKISQCNMMTLQCIGSVRAVLTPENGMPVMGQCSTPSGMATTLCDPTQLFSQPLFDQIPGGRVSLKIVGYKDANCANALFEATTATFDVGTAASSSTPIPMTASCTPSSNQTICDQVLNVQGNIVGWPPNMQRDPPNVSGANYQVGFGYDISGSGDTGTTFRKLFDVSYNPLPTSDHSLTGVGVIPQDIGMPRCLGYQATAIPAQGMTTLTCYDKSVLVNTVQRLDAYYVTPTPYADAATAVASTNGVLLGQVTRNGIGLDGVVITADDFSTGPVGSRLYYYNSTTSSFAQPASATDGSGLFAIIGVVGGASVVSVSGSKGGVGSTPTTTHIILPRQATVFDMQL